MTFEDRIKGLKFRPHHSIIKGIEQKTFPLKCPLLKLNPEALAAVEFTRCAELFERKLPYEHSLPFEEVLAKLPRSLMGIYNMIQERELAHKEQLQLIAAEVTQEIYDVPSHIVLKPSIRKKSDIDCSLDLPAGNKPSSISKERLALIEEEIQKRIFLNSLVHGAAIHVWKSAHHLVKDKIDALDGQLFDLYEIYISIVSFMLWQFPPDYFGSLIKQGKRFSPEESGYITQGFCSVKFDEPGKPHAEVEVVGVNFPVLLHELTKGVMDYIICAGVPHDFTEEELEYYYSQADAHEHEIWHYLLGPSVWQLFLKEACVSTQELAMELRIISELPYEGLVNYFGRIINKK